MYGVLINDYEINKQFAHCRTTEYHIAVDCCKKAAERFVVGKEGKRYMDGKIYFNKAEVKKRGYFLTIKENTFSVKINVYYKEPNGAIYSGDVRKIKQFYTAFIGLEVKIVEDPENVFDKCLRELVITVESNTKIKEMDKQIQDISDEIDDMNEFYDDSIIEN